MDKEEVHKSPIKLMSSLGKNFALLMLITDLHHMICSNIIIFTQSDPQDDEEIESVKNFLKARYGATRKMHEIQFDTWGDTPQFLTITGDGLPMENKPDTGIYVIVHGAQATGLLPPLMGTERADLFASWLVTLTEKEFQIRKICFITCAGMAVDGAGDTRKAKPIPTTDKNVAATYVQNFCYAISKLPQVESLNGLMIAGYSSGVYLGNVEGRRTGAKLTQKNKPEHPMHPTPAVKKDLTKKLQSYARNKMVYILERGTWRLGSLHEYTDNAELKSALIKRNVT